MNPEINTMLPVMLAILANILGYSIKLKLRDNGYKIYWFWRHEADLVNMVKLIRNTEDTSMRKSYLALYISYILSILLFIGSVIIVIRTNSWINY